MEFVKKNYGAVLTKARTLVAEGLTQCDAVMMSVAESAPGGLSTRLSKILERKGKRVRSTILYLVAATGTTQPDPQRAARAAAAIELIHLASLIHDDVIDASQMRRGELTAHYQWGNKIAVLVGDYVLSRSLELVLCDEDRRVPQIVTQASGHLVAGEILETDLSASGEISYELYLEVIDGKTASLLERCCTLGAILAGHSPELVQKCAQMGRNFGVAFQMIDDLLDFGLGAEDLGKSTYADLSNGVLTLPVILYLDSVSKTEALEFRQLCARSTEPPVQKQIFSLLQNAGVFIKAQALATQRIEAALAVIEELPPTPAAQHLREMCSAMIFRH